MNKLALNLFYIMPVMAMMSGLSLGLVIPLFCLIALYLIKEQIKIDLSNFKLEISFLSLIFLSCFWSIEPIDSIISFVKTALTLSIFAILSTNKNSLFQKIFIDPNKCLFALLAAFLIFYLEFFTDGFFNKAFREFFHQKSYGNGPILTVLDRGCAFASLFAWVIISRYTCEKKYYLSFFTYLITITTLYFSDNLAAFIGFLVAGIAFIIAKYTFFKNPKIISSILLIIASFFVYFSINGNLPKYHLEIKQINYSAIHRLFIWDFTANKAAEKPILGWGHNASRQIKIPKEDFITYNTLKFNPLPTHPHNNLLQIFLENGLLGLALYLAIICKYILKSYNLRDENLRYSSYGYIATWLIISMISFNMWQSWWVCSFLMCYLIKIDQSQS